MASATVIGCAVGGSVVFVLLLAGLWWWVWRWRALSAGSDSEEDATDSYITEPIPSWYYDEEMVVIRREKPLTPQQISIVRRALKAGRRRATCGDPEALPLPSSPGGRCPVCLDCKSSCDGLTVSAASDAPEDHSPDALPAEEAAPQIQGWCLLPCGHGLHSKCLEPWFTGAAMREAKFTCPVCRKEVPEE